MNMQRGPRILSVQGSSPNGVHEVFYTEWGEPAAERVVVCCHGLTRNGRDFDVLAQRLVTDPRQPLRVICPDIAGRGRSEWLRDPAYYAYPQYLADMTAMIARLGVAQVDWIGTSMGGLIGMFLAAAPNAPIRALVLNDVGPVLPQAALARIADYVGRDPHFDDIASVEAHLRQVHAPFGPLTDGQWTHLARHGHRFLADGRYGLAYDPGIAVNVRLGVKDWDLWASWDAITCPTLVLRGRNSDLLPAAVAQEMTRRGPKATLIEFDGIGHAPALMADDQTGTIATWLAAQR
jgi:pimeloyl-ACP methyl ester carboxylesterase